MESERILARAEEALRRHGMEPRLAQRARAARRRSFFGKVKRIALVAGALMIGLPLWGLIIAPVGTTGLMIAVLAFIVAAVVLMAFPRTPLVAGEVLPTIASRCQPVRFDAKFATPGGDRSKRRISQRAVQNISSIGGAGAGAAIQASFLRFFETFGYRRIALSCKLVAGVCEMGGLDRGEGGFTLIEGGGLPSLTVVGYNRFVGWQEMLDRIRSVIDGNTRMIVQ